MEADNVTPIAPANMIQIPVVQYKEFQFPIRTVKEDDWAVPKEGVLTPESVIRELRSHVVALDDRITILLAALSLVQEPEVKDFLKTIGLIVVDVHRKQFPVITPIPEPETTTQN